MRLTLLLALPLAAAASPAAAAPGSLDTVWAESTPAQACAALDQVALKKIRRTEPGAEMFDRFHAQARGGAPGAPTDAQVVVRVGVSGGMTAGGIGGPESITVWRGGDGVWRGSRAYQRRPDPYGPVAAPPPPQWPAPADAADVRNRIIAAPATEREVREGRIDAKSAALLERALGARCLRKEPPTLPLELPLKGGGSDYCAPDSAHWIVEIWRGAKTRRFARPCQLVGPVGVIARILERVSIDGPAALYWNGKPLYAVAASPTAEMMQAFLAGTLPGSSFDSLMNHKKGILESYVPVGACAGEFRYRVEAEAEPVVVRHEWAYLREAGQYAELGEVTLDFGMSLPERLKLGGTVEVLKARGAFDWLRRHCYEKTVGAPAR